MTESDRNKIVDLWATMLRIKNQIKDLPVANEIHFMIDDSLNRIILALESRDLSK